MERIACRYCGLPFKIRRLEPGREYFCCTGCAMLSQVPVDEKGQFPVNVHLLSALATGFLFFNQLLFWLVAVLLVRDGRMILALRFFWLTFAAALAVWGSLAFLQWKERSTRAADVLFMAAGLIMLAAACRRLPPVPMDLALSNLALILWTLRGLLLKRIR